MTRHLLLVGLGPHARQKYLPMIAAALQDGLLGSYEVLDLETARLYVTSALAEAAARPERVTFIADRRPQGIWFADETEPLLQRIRDEHPSLKIVIATEPKAHFGYLQWCTSRGVPCIVDKPILAPTDAAGRFAPQAMEGQFAALMRNCASHPAAHSVMTPRRYFPVYEIGRRLIARYIAAFGCPITHIAAHYSEGVWNLPGEYLSREDHPYKYGYGMLMHSSYHMIDVMAQFLELNGAVIPADDLIPDVSVRCSYPEDQTAAIPAALYERFVGAQQSSLEPLEGNRQFGETDALVTLDLRRRSTNRRVTLGSLSLLQTGASLRNWHELPLQQYNRNGRFALEELRLSLGFLLNLTIRILALPGEPNGPRTRFSMCADYTLMRNSNIVGGRPFRQKTIDMTRPERGREVLFARWLQGIETTSSLPAHAHSFALFSKIVQAAQLDRRGATSAPERPRAATAMPAMTFPPPAD